MFHAPRARAEGSLGCHRQSFSTKLTLLSTKKASASILTIEFWGLPLFADKIIMTNSSADSQNRLIRT